VFVHASNFFKHYVPLSTVGTAVAVDLSLTVWNLDTDTQIAAATTHINANTTSLEEEVVFAISGAPAIPSGTNVLYAVYVPDSLALDIRGELLCYQSGTNLYSNGVYWKSDQANDTTILDFENKWDVNVTDTWDLKFKLGGTEQ
jgi:hypothetical protein